MLAKPRKSLRGDRLAYAILALALIASAVAGDRGPSPDGTHPLLQPSPIKTIEKQTEPHTCGFHTLSSIYKAHGLDSERFQLRQRLGVDVPAVPALNNSTGTVQPDMVRALSQDGFLTTSLDPKDAATKEALWFHFRDGLYAAACITRRENGHWHWVILSGNHGSDLLVGDSLRSEEGFYREPYEDFMNNHVLNVLTIRADPNKARSIRSSWQLHVQGWHSLITSVAATAPWAGIALPLTVLFGWPWLLKRFATKLTWGQAFIATSSTLATAVLGTFFLAYVVPLGFTIAGSLALVVGAHFIRNSVATSWCKSLSLLTISAMSLAFVIGSGCLVWVLL